MTTQIDTVGTSEPIMSDDATQETFLSATRRNLEQREDFAGQTYRAVRDNPKTSAAIATGVVAAAAGTTAFLLNRKSKIGTATGHASAGSEILDEVNELNNDTMSKLKQDAVSDLNKDEIKAGSVAY